MESPVDESGRSRRHGVDALLGEKNRVARGFGELLKAGSDVDGVTDEGELELAAAADGSGDHHPGVDPYADPKVPAESLGDKTVNQNSGGDSGIGMIRKVIRSAEDGQRPVTQELVDVPTGVDDSRHHDLEQRVEAGDRVLGGISLDDITVTSRRSPVKTSSPCSKQPRRQNWVDVGPERRLKSLPLSQSRLHAVERRRQRTEIVVLNHR